MKLSHLTPLNLFEEKSKFFSSEDFQYNPQFTYPQQYEPHELRVFGEPLESFYQHSLSLLQLYPPQKNDTGTEISQVECTQKIEKIVTIVGLPALPITFSPHLISGFMINKSGIHIKIPIELNKMEFEQKLNHEVQTHYLRRTNASLTQLKTSHKIECKFTEEGLANIHSFIESDTKILEKSYLNYIAMYASTTQSFSQVFKQLLSFGISEERAWTITVKNKRGIADTRLGGGPTLAKTYLEGLYQVASWINQNDPHKLFLGHLSLAEIDELQTSIVETLLPKIYLPTFFNSTEIYRKKVAEIVTANQLSKFMQ